MKNKGQALVEFIIVLPVLIIILLGIIDFGMIFYKKNYLENTLEEITEIWKKEQSKESVDSYLNDLDNHIKIDLKKYEEKVDIDLEMNYEVMTPGLNLILGNPYEIKVSRVIYNG